MPRLNPDLLKYLTQNLNLSENSVRQYISRIKIKYPSLTQNAAAHIFAQVRGFSVRKYLGKEDKASIPGIEIEKPGKILVKKKKLDSKRKIINFFKYNSDDRFIKGHIDEVNRAYTFGCFTCVFVLSRKIIENLIIDILAKKFPEKRELYWDSSRNRYLDFSIVIDNLHRNKSSFSPKEVEVIGRLNQLVKPFKKDGNDKTHSWYHLARKKEIDEIGIEDILSLIKILENK